MEILDLYDNQGRKTTEKIPRGEVIPEGKNIMLSVIFIKNEEGKYLIQKTSKEKGNRYSSTGGHVVNGESGFEAIKRELNEELGININDNKIKFLATFKYPKKNCLFNAYMLEISMNEIKNMKLQDEEVEEVKYLSVEEIINIIKDGNFLESHAYIFEKYIKC